MKKFYFWYGITIIAIATTFNYSVLDGNRSYSSSSSSSSSSYRSSGGWHK